MVVNTKCPEPRDPKHLHGVDRNAGPLMVSSMTTPSRKQSARTSPPTFLFPYSLVKEQNLNSTEKRQFKLCLSRRFSGEPERDVVASCERWYSAHSQVWQAPIFKKSSHMQSCGKPAAPPRRLPGRASPRPGTATP
jgi:hypothetical protein